MLYKQRVSLSIVALVLLQCIAGGRTAITAQGGYNNGAVAVQWSIFDNIKIIFTVLAEFPAAGWLGVGWHATNLTTTCMPFADIVVAQFDGNGNLISILDYYRNASNPGQPSLDTDIGGQNNIFNASGSQSVLFNGTSNVYTTQLMFARLLNTGDSVADVLLTPGNTSFIAAYGSGPAFPIAHSRAYVYFLDLYGGSNQPAPPPSSASFVGVSVVSLLLCAACALATL